MNIQQAQQHYRALRVAKHYKEHVRPILQRTVHSHYMEMNGCSPSGFLWRICEPFSNRNYIRDEEAKGPVSCPKCRCLISQIT